MTSTRPSRDWEVVSAVSAQLDLRLSFFPWEQTLTARQKHGNTQKVGRVQVWKKGKFARKAPQ